MHFNLEGFVVKSIMDCQWRLAGAVIFQAVMLDSYTNILLIC